MTPSRRSTFSALATFSSGLNVTAGTATLGSTTNVGADFHFLTGSTPSLETYLVQASSGAGIKWRYFSGPDADTTIAAGTYDIVRIGAITGAANRNYTLSNAVEGIAILITMAQAAGSGTNSVTIKDGGGSSLSVLKYQVAAFAYKALMVFTGGLWVVADVDLF